MNDAKIQNIIFRVDAITAQLCDIAELCGKHDQMHLIPHLEKMYDQIEIIKFNAQLNCDNKHTH